MRSRHPRGVAATIRKRPRTRAHHPALCRCWTEIHSQTLGGRGGDVPRLRPSERHPSRSAPSWPIDQALTKSRTEPYPIRPTVFPSLRSRSMRVIRAPPNGDRHLGRWELATSAALAKVACCRTAHWGRCVSLARSDDPAVWLGSARVWPRTTQSRNARETPDCPWRRSDRRHAVPTGHLGMPSVREYPLLL
jgi:hypothetical protein